jgi:rubrerythrin
MYPQMIEDAKEEGDSGARMSFEMANAVEKIHAELYQKALEAMGDLADTDYYVCDICGNTVEGGPQAKCTICGAAEDHFFKVD